MLGWLVTQYWRMFNIAARVVGSLFLAWSALVLYSTIVNPTMDWKWGLFAGLFGICGFLTLRVKAVRPDLDGPESAFGHTATEARTWWTGDPKVRDKAGDS